MGIADLHIHTVHSWDGTATVPAVLKYAADYTNLDVIAITDHDCIRGALEALQLAPRYGIEVIPGCEITTANGHLLALFIEKLVPAGLTLVETVHRVGDLGGICIAAHPGARVKTSLSPKVLREALVDAAVRKTLVGFEGYNAGLVYSASNAMAYALATELEVARVGSSDAHLVDAIGWGATEFAGFFPEDLRRSLERHATRVFMRQSASGASKVMRWAPRMLLRRFGWVTTNRSPYSPLRLGRLPREPRGWAADPTLVPENL